MAEKRMFTQKITESDAFLEMPVSSQALYFHLCMNADDDGFVNNPKKIQRMVGASDDDGKILVSKRFVLPFESGVIVIKHWRMHNLLRKDRYKETDYKEEKSLLYIKENNSYTFDKTQGQPLLATKWQPNGNQMAPQDSIGKNSIEKNNKENILKEDINVEEKGIKETKHKYGEYKHVLLTDTEYNKLLNEYGKDETLNAITYLDEYIEMKGLQYKSHYLALRKWVFEALKRNKHFNNRIYSKKELNDLYDNLDNIQV